MSFPLLNFSLKWLARGRQSSRMPKIQIPPFMHLDSGLDVLCTLLILAGIVECICILYRLATASDSRLYVRVLRDTYGPWIESITVPGAVRWHERGPFQFLRWRPRGRLSLLSKNEIICALEEQTAGWFRRTFQVLRIEAAVQANGYRGYSPNLHNFLRELRKASNMSSSNVPSDEGQSAQLKPAGQDEVKEFFESWKWLDENVPSERLPSASALLIAFRALCFPDLKSMEENYSHILNVYSTELGRRTIRQRLTIAACAVLYLISFCCPPVSFCRWQYIALALGGISGTIAFLTLIATMASPLVTKGMTSLFQMPLCLKNPEHE